MCKYVKCRKTYAGCQRARPNQHYIDEDLYELEDCSPDGINPCANLERSTKAIFGSSNVGGDCPYCEEIAWEEIERQRQEDEAQSAPSYLREASTGFEYCLLDDGMKIYKFGEEHWYLDSTNNWAEYTGALNV